MRVLGERTKRTRLIQTEMLVVEVEMVIPPDDPSEVCYQAETVWFLQEVRQRANGEDGLERVDWAFVKAWLLREVKKGDTLTE